MADTPESELANDLAHAVQLLRASHDMYQEILRASLDHVGRDELDIPAFLKRLNGALVGFKSHDSRIASLLARYRA
ncbi:MAG: hypothetical protein O3C65_01160 [Proteobacteria bacterium]|nr:hypothetical protein [Pseudomonadota bacterium]MDA1057267.1 hypothetical protein [Pseudomonadota bacterium]